MLYSFLSFLFILLVRRHHIRCLFGSSARHVWRNTPSYSAWGKDPSQWSGKPGGNPWLAQIARGLFGYYMTIHIIYFIYNIFIYIYNSYSVVATRSPLRMMSAFACSCF